jgi:hypothetical protein
MFWEWKQSHDLSFHTHPELCSYGRRLQFVNNVAPDWDAHHIITHTAGIACAPVLAAHNEPRKVVVAQSLRIHSSHMRDSTLLPDRLANRDISKPHDPHLMVSRHILLLVAA